MSTMIVELYDALISAGAPDDKARAASKAIADYEGRFAKIEADLLAVKWMCGVIVAGVVSLVLKAYL
jgi:hypothetical protein